MKIYYSSASKPSSMSVTQLNNYVRDLLDDDILLSNAEVEGEISNFKHYLSTGHMYFTLKDENSSVSAVMYKNANQYLNFLPYDGMKVTLNGSVSLYPQNGRYQIYVRDIKPNGEGELLRQYELLKKKLSNEGLFDEERKKHLPAFPSKVGIITSKFGAALQDIINVSKRRCPISELYVYPSAVQGLSAHKELIAGIEYFSRTKSVDVIIIGRGGGSIEDLWCFNNENLAYTISECDIPIISAVGHETDFTICDFVSDMRAPTPSAAAELVFPDISELSFELNSLSLKLKEAIYSRINDVENALSLFMKEKISVRLLSKYEKLFEIFGNYEDNIKSKTRSRIISKEERMLYLSSLLEAKSPLSILSKGYALVCGEDNKTIKSTSALQKGDNINIRFCDGEANAEIKNIRQNTGKDGQINA